MGGSHGIHWLLSSITKQWLRCHVVWLGQGDWSSATLCPVPPEAPKGARPPAFMHKSSLAVMVYVNVTQYLYSSKALNMRKQQKALIKLHVTILDLHRKQISNFIRNFPTKGTYNKTSWVEIISGQNPDFRLLMCIKLLLTFVHQIRCNHMRYLCQSEWRDLAPHLESGFQFVPVVLRCGGKPVSSSHPFLRAER